MSTHDDEPLLGAPDLSVTPSEPRSWSGAALGPTSSEGSEPSLPSDFLREVARAPASGPFAERDLSGQTLGRYRVLSRLGRGAMGVVYAAEDQTLRRPVALKVLPPHLLGDAERRRRFLREARAAAAAAHPNIAAVYDVVEAGDHVFIAMERVEGRTLREALADAEARGLPPREVARIAHRIAGGLVRAHEAGVIHRDLKPENVMLGPGDQVKILDFGVAKLRADRPSEPDETKPSTLTEDGQLLGTPSYMAPEQAKGLPIDERADIFSLGVILYEMATGARPFTGKTSAEVLIAVDRDDPAPPSRRNPAVPLELSSIIERCLQKRADARYSSAAELAEDLLRFEASKAAERASSSNAGASSAARTRRRWAAWGLAALLALPLAALAQRARISGHLGPLPGSSESAVAAASPLARPGAALACPVLEASGVEEPSGWLGAAAASLACRRARMILGGEATHVIVPAALLGLPGQPHEDFPLDPFSSPDARSRALAAAHARGAVYLDGSVERRAEGFRVRLVLKDAADHELGHGEGAGVALHQAIRTAMDPLVRPDAIPQAAAVDSEVATWSGVREAGLLVALTDWEFSSFSHAAFREEQARLAPRRAEIGPRWEGLLAEVASMSGEGWEQLAPPPIDRSSPSSFARSAPVHALLEPHADAAALAVEASALAAAEPSPVGRAALAFAEGRLRNRAGDDARASALFLTAIQRDPTSSAWNPLVNITQAQSAPGTAARAYTAWWPEASNAWNVLSLSDRPKEHEPSVRGTLRAHILSPGVPIFAVHESMNRVARGMREEARAIAAELLSVSAALGAREAFDPRLVAGEYVLASVEASEARFGAALSRTRRVLSSLPAFGNLIAAEFYLATLAMDLGMLLGRAPEVAEEFVRTFIDAEPPRLRPGQFVPGRVASVCALAPTPSARRCFERLRSLIAAGFFREDALPTDTAFIEGADAYARGDYVAATAAWRPMARMPASHQRNLLPDAFERAGETDLAERTDKRMLNMNGPFNGASLPHLRAARRLLARGERAAGEKLGLRIIEAWSLADVPVPAVAELRALLAARGSGKVSAPGSRPSGNEPRPR
jgi:predicted Ser/Thr protein kinase